MNLTLQPRQYISENAVIYYKSDTSQNTVNKVGTNSVL